MASQIERWREEDKAAFGRLMQKWPNGFLINGKRTKPRKEFIDNICEGDWRQYGHGNWIATLDGVCILDGLDIGVYPYTVCIPHDSWLTRKSPLTKHLLGLALGFQKPDSYAGSGTRSWCGLVNWNNLEIAAVYIAEVDMTGQQRLTHTELLYQALDNDRFECRVPRPILATTNCYFSEFIRGSQLNDINKKELLEAELDLIRKNLIATKMWDSRFQIDSSKSNFISDQNGNVFNVDPIYLHSSLQF